MNLFNHAQNFIKGNTNALNLSTPLGPLQFDFSFNNNEVFNIKPVEILINQTTTLMRWSLDECFIEFLIFQFDPKIPPHMKVDNCVAGVWRIRNLSKNLKPVFKTYLVDEQEGSPESGEGLISQLFQNESINLSIGTEDEEFLNQRAEINQWMPERLKDNIHVEAVETIPGGIRISLPPYIIKEHKLMPIAQKRLNMIGWDLKG